MRKISNIAVSIRKTFGICLALYAFAKGYTFILYLLCATEIIAMLIKNQKAKR
jgi:hypothetical protein